MPRLSVIFFGSGPVAAKSLELLTAHADVIAVVTKPKPAHHRGNAPVIEIAEKLQLPLHTVTNKKELSQLIAAKAFQTDAAVLIDFGIIVSQDVIDYFPKGIINSHFSLLPEWRGADPITFSILSGQKKTGVSLMLLVEAMDEGPLLAQSELDIEDTDTSYSLTEKLIDLSDAMLQAVLPLWLEGKVDARQQLEVSLLEDKTPTYSRKLTKADGELDFSKPAEVLEREMRAYIEWPKSHALLAGTDVIITKASVTADKGEPGAITVKDRQLIVYCGENALRIERLKPAGKSEMDAQAFIAGYGNRLA